MRLVLRVIQRGKVKLKKKKDKCATSQESSSAGREIEFLCSSE
jgi:hypothetical protein